MSMYQHFKTDPALEKNGVVHDFGTFRVTLARAGGANKRFGTLMEALSKPFKRAIQTESMPDEQANKILREVYAKAIVLKWETKVKVEDPTADNGEKMDTYVVGIEPPPGYSGTVDKHGLLPFNHENVMLTLELLPDLFTDFREQAVKSALYREVLKETDSGNL